MLRVQNRPGNVHDGKAAVPFLRATPSTPRHARAGLPVRIPHGRGLFPAGRLARLVRAGAQYAIKVPFYRWVGLQEKVRQTRQWTRVTARVSCAEHALTLAPWGGAHFRVVLYRTHVQHETAKNFQLDLFDPSDGHYENSAVVTNKAIGGPALWAFMCGRGTHERVYGELKTGFAFACVPSMHYAANSAWQCSASSRSI